MSATLELAVAATSLAIQKESVNVDQLDTAKPLVEIFQTYQSTLEKWEAKAKSLVVTDIAQKAEMQMARVARLELKEARVAMDKTRKGLVENLKARTSKIDGTARIIREKIEGLEAILLESEEFAERYAAKVKADLKSEREAELIPFLDSPLVIDLSNLSKEAYAGTLAGAKQLRQAKLDAAAKAESDRLAKEAADKAERERIAAENAKLKEIAAAMERQAAIEKQAYEAEVAEAKRLAEIERKRVADERAKEKAAADAERRRVEDERQAEREKAEAERLAERKKADAERAAVEAKARKEREAIQAKAAEAAKKAREETDRLNAELAAKAKAEAAEKARIEAERVAKEREAKRAAAAPDKIKLTALVRTIRAWNIPFSNQKLASDLNSRIEALAEWIESQIDSELL